MTTLLTLGVICATEHLVTSWPKNVNFMIHFAAQQIF